MDALIVVYTTAKQPKKNRIKNCNKILRKENRFVQEMFLHYEGFKYIRMILSSLSKSITIFPLIKT